MGGAGIRAAIQKGPVHQVIDDFVNGQDTPRQAFLDDLKALLPADDDQTISYLALLQRHLPNLDARFLHYLHDTWYNPSTPPLPRSPIRGVAGFWPVEYHPTEPVVRRGLIKALELAITTGLPLDSYWMPVGDRFETLVIQTDRQVIRLILTPPTPPPPRLDMVSNSAAIWVTKRGIAEPWEIAEDESGSVVITRLKVVETPGWPSA